MKKDIIVKDIIEVTKGELIAGDENTIFDNFSKKTEKFLPSAPKTAKLQSQIP